MILGVDVRTVSYHLGQIFASGELKEEATIRKIGIVQTEGEREVNRPQMMQVVAGTGIWVYPSTCPRD